MVMFCAICSGICRRRNSKGYSTWVAVSSTSSPNGNGTTSRRESGSSRIGVILLSQYSSTGTLPSWGSTFWVDWFYGIDRTSTRVLVALHAWSLLCCTTGHFHMLNDRPFIRILIPNGKSIAGIRKKCYYFDMLPVFQDCLLLLFRAVA